MQQRYGVLDVVVGTCIGSAWKVSADSVEVQGNGGKSKDCSDSERRPKRPKPNNQCYLGSVRWTSPRPYWKEHFTLRGLGRRALFAGEARCCENHNALSFRRLAATSEKRQVVMI